MKWLTIEQQESYGYKNINVIFVKKRLKINMQKMKKES